VKLDEECDGYDGGNNADDGDGGDVTVMTALM